MNREPERPPSRIPEFSSIEEEAEFWDTHDFTDYLDESWPVTMRVSPDFKSVYAVYLDREVYEALSQRAREQGSDPSALANAWIRERLRPEELVKQTAD